MVEARGYPIIPFYPASYDLSNIISVAATNNDDLLTWFSNYGAISVDLGAPGDEIGSTWARNPDGPVSEYVWRFGTSMAAPHVSGVVALLWSLNPHWSWQTVKDRVLLTARPIPALTGITVTGGVVNAYDAINDCNLNGVPDLQDISGGTSADCNQNHLPDECDIASGRSADCEPNGVPDECEPRGSCCLGTTCSITTQPCCVNQGGTFTGVGTTCGSPLVGACCVDTTCTVASQTCCSSQGGAFIGVGTTCADGNGNGVPDLCDPACSDGEDLHPCCLSQNICILWTAECCSAVGGEFFPTKIKCIHVTCSRYQTSGPTPEP